ncbi:MAG: glycoside hydrolase family 2 protein [Planctomycetes bacterium]|nr:glycoside hydrolase family 2 protein [Planctomycetota bacterium]
MDVVDLCGAWDVRSTKPAMAVPATVPGCIHTDLLAAGKIPDPFYRTNEIDVQWVGMAAWTYERTFELSEAFCGHRRILLRCDGLDTVATVTVNNRRIGSTENQFRTWEFDVAGVVRPGTNTIAVRFDCPLPLQWERMGEGALVGHCHSPWEWPGRSTVRKSQSNYGWDWGPSLPTCGIWRPIRLIGFDEGRITDVAVAQHHGRGRVDLGIAVEAELLGRPRAAAAVTVRLKNKVVAEGRVELRRGAGSVSLTIRKPVLWWPNGMGDQPLYEVLVDLVDADGIVLDTAGRRIGLRTLGLDRHPDEWGESFQFAVNGVPFFAKGGNWIPADQFPTRVTEADYRRLLGDCAAANMNMIRVWGGGIYEPDLFYDLCDELGLCVWQDFMFACRPVPANDEAFVENVRLEAIDNVRRLRHHACLALWCGNNEMEQMNVAQTWTATKMSWADYKPLFDGVLPKVVRKYDPQRDYWPSSSHSPRGDRGDFNNPKWGDAHLWSVWHGKQPFEWYRTCEHRFNSEFGFQSFPEPRTVKGYTAPGDRNVTSPVMEHHQRSGIGNATIIHYMLDWFRLPHSFDAMLWLSQIQHGMAMKYAVEHWRRSMPRGMGTLYWQINDCWPVASWSSIDYHGRWKALQYMARHFFAPVLVSGVEDAATSTVEVHVTNDTAAAIAGHVRWSVMDLDGRELDGGRLPVRAAARKNTFVRKLDVSRHARRYGGDLQRLTRNPSKPAPGQGAENLIIRLTLEGRGGKVLATNLVTLSRPKRLELRDPKIKATLRKADGGAFRVTLTAARPALWAWLELGNADARYSDNFVHLAPGEPVEIIVQPAARMSAAAFRRQLKVRSLVDTY